MDISGGTIPMGQQQAAAAVTPALDSGQYVPWLDNNGVNPIAPSADAMFTTAAVQPAFADPSQAAAVMTPSAFLPDDSNSQTAVTQPDATTILPTSATVSNTPVLSTGTISVPLSASSSSILQPSSVSALLPSATNTVAPASGSSGSHFKITYLIPVFVLLGLLLLLAVGGKIWGRVAFAKERAMKRNERRRHEAQQIANETRNAYIQPWQQEKGWAAFDASMEMQRDGQDLDARSDDDEGRRHVEDVHGGRASKYGVQLYDGPAPCQSNDSNGDLSEHDLRGPLSALGTHLAGQRFGQHAPPPPARLEHDRFRPQLAANSWWTVQWSRHFGPDIGSGTYDGLQNTYAAQQQESSATTAARWVAKQKDEGVLARRRSKRGMLARMKSRLGWGYGRSSPLLGDRRSTHASVIPPQAPSYWTRIPQAEDEALYDAVDTTKPAYEQWPQPYGRPMEEEEGEQQLNYDRTLPPTPMTAVNTSTPLARKRVQDVRPYHLSRAQTQSTVSSSIKRMANVKPVARSSTLAAACNRPMISPSGAVIEDSEEEEEVIKTVRQLKSLNAMAEMASLHERERSSALQRNKTMGPLKSAPRKKRNGEASSGGSRLIGRENGGLRGSFKRQTVRMPVNFGDHSVEEEELDVAQPNLPALDSFLLSRTRSSKLKDRVGVGMVLSDYEGSDVFSPETEGEVVMDFGRKHSTNYSEHSATSSMPALSRGSTVTRSSLSSHDVDEGNAIIETPMTNTDDMGAEIDDALLRIIARSNTSKSFAKSVGGFASASVSPVQRDNQPTNGTPIGRTSTWRKDQGRWMRSPTNALEAASASPGKGLVSSLPPTLSTPPLAVLPLALLAASPSRKSVALASRRGSTQQSSSLSQNSSHVRQTPLSHLDQRQRSGTSHAKIGCDLFFGQGDVPANSVKQALLAEVRRSAAINAAASTASSRTPTERSQSTRSSIFSGVSDGVTSSSSSHSGGTTTRSSTLLTQSERVAPPTRRTAIAKRGAPIHYATKSSYSSCEDDEYRYDDHDHSGVMSNYQRLHTGKSLRTPAEKRREQTYAMDRVQSILTRARASQPDITL